MRTIFCHDTETLPAPAITRPWRQEPLRYFIPYRFNGPSLRVFWPDGSLWLHSSQVPQDVAQVHSFVLRAFWSLELPARNFALAYWQTSPSEPLAGTETLILTDEELLTLFLLEYSEAEARFSSRHRAILPAGPCPPFDAYAPTAN